MPLPKKDIIATCLVAAAGLVYLLWAVDSSLPGMSSTRTAGIIVLVLGFIASASAVVPTFDSLIHGNKAYLAVTSCLGLVAFLGGLVMLISASGAAFTVVIFAMIVLWAITTTHHVRLAKRAASEAIRPAPTARRRHATPAR